MNAKLTKDGITDVFLSALGIDARRAAEFISRNFSSNDQVSPRALTHQESTARDERWVAGKMESRILKRRIVGAIATLWCCAGASAEDGRGFYAGLGLGEATSFASSPTRGEDFEDSALSFRALAGYSFWKYLAIEANYVYGDTAEGSFGPYDLELSSSTVTLSAAGTWPIGRWGLSLKLGYGYYDADQSIRLGGLATSSSHADHDVAGGLAASYRFNDRYSVRAEYDVMLLGDGHASTLGVVGIYKF